ncbi:MAG: type II secretion system protein GspD [Pirellulaceae bacterium]
MSATARLLSWCVAFGLTLSVSSVLAGPNVMVGGTHVSWIVLGQADQGDSAASRREAEKWLRLAREAMKIGDLQRAEYCIERAEKMAVKQSSLFFTLKDSPAKARQDLDGLRAKQGKPKAAAGPLSKLFHSDKGGATSPPSDLYGGQSLALPQAGIPGGLNAAGRPLAGPGPSRLPTTRSASESDGQALGSTRSLGDMGGSDRQARSSDMLRDARAALARGDAQRASLLVEQTRNLGLTYPLNTDTDSPDKADALIRRAAKFSQGPAAGSDAVAYTRDFAQFLMDQATGLVGYGAFDEAQQLAQQAKDLRATYGQFDRTPEQVLTQVAAARRHALGEPTGPGNPDAPWNLTDDTTDAPRRLPPASGEPVGGLAENKVEALRLIAEARAAVDRGDLLTAKQSAELAQHLVPESAYTANETRPWMVLLEVNKALNARGGVVQAGNVELQTRNALATDQNSGGAYPVSQGIYDPATDASRNVAAQSLQPTPAAPPEAERAATQVSVGQKLYQDGLRALQSRDRESALRMFRDAWKYERELDPATRQQLQDKLILLQSDGAPPVAAAENTQPSTLEAVDAKQQLLRQKLYREITSEQAEAQRMSANDPKGALERLLRLRDRVNDSEVDPSSKKQLLTLVDRSAESLEQYIETNKADIQLTERNREVVDGVKLDAQREQEIQSKLASLVEEFNQLLEEQRYAEAERIAKQARELDPEAEVVENLMWQSRFIRRMQEQMSIDDKKEQGFYDASTAVLDSSAPFDDREPYKFGEAKEWGALSMSRAARLEQQRQRMSKAELEIQKSLSNKVDVKFNDRPLAEVMDLLSELSGVPIVLDPVGMAAEGVTTDTPVTIRLTQQISLRSALNLVLAPLRLSYVIQDEVLRVTSEQTRDSNVYHKVYNVADLVIPIPNFIPGYNTGLAGAIQYAHSTLGYGNNMTPMGRVPMAVAANDLGAASSNTSVLAQMGAGGALASLGAQASQPSGFGPGGMGGAAMADFDTLIDLVTSTIAPDSWDEVGGAGAIEPFPVNLSLVISQTQEVHEQIADLLEQLRRLQDLQVTIEVRFITLSDNFFERLGVDFDFSIDDNVNVDRISGSNRTGGLGDDAGPSAVIGLTTTGPTQTLDLEFTQGSFGATLPQFGNYDPATAANFGFAILSDLEVFFLLQAAEGDQRTNVLQAPKVTLFNGQTATVQDQSQRPFVTSIIPVVGDFAAAQQPVIVVLNEGTQLNVQAVVSSDRRFVRLTLVPFFSRIGSVEEFTFEGKTTSDTSSDVVVVDPTTGSGSDSAKNITTREGTTVQLPTFIYTTVSTTVSVPDGGTVLLGGIKRLNEGRTERGVPMLSKLPYINRLFKNVGIGRETQSLMMMVTPRIIIQEEEELDQTGYNSSP